MPQKWDFLFLFLGVSECNLIKKFLYHYNIKE